MCSGTRSTSGEDLSVPCFQRVLFCTVSSWQGVISEDLQAIECNVVMVTDPKQCQEGRDALSGPVKRDTLLVAIYPPPPIEQSVTLLIKSLQCIYTHTLRSSPPLL